MNIVIFGICICVMALTIAVGFLFRRQDRILNAQAKQALKISDHESAIAAYEEVDRYNFSSMLADHDKRLRLADHQLAELAKRFDELPVEDLEAQYEAEKAWNDGVQAIVSFGLEQLQKGGNGE